ncbi:hypothetical protein M4R22_16635 [Acidovorax sp. GBBC 3334]|uniref:hypothetical protein n=1 Tax=Acidovorax sp. GBBC 3334 TaxID=2940496 RepID=UPI0023044550|nr:hypothetical protein [Acidovorax sp. GBBC 3334]MDA8456392.1 hypothetical protein [Acidovorax sp. GBBC 3334]
MPSTTVFLLALSAFLAFGACWGRYFGGRAPGPFRSRSCQGRAWKRAFPHAGKAQIRRFLAMFAESFGLRPDQRLQFAPHDRILAVYRARYPCTEVPDALELETLTAEAERLYGVDLEDLWHDRLTLGELFAVCGQPRADG